MGGGYGQRNRGGLFFTLLRGGDVFRFFRISFIQILSLREKEFLDDPFQNHSPDQVRQPGGKLVSYFFTFPPDQTRTFLLNANSNAARGFGRY